MVRQFFIPKPTRKGAETELRRRLFMRNKDKPKSKRIELKSLRKHKSSVGGRPFFIATIRKEK